MVFLNQQFPNIIQPEPAWSSTEHCVFKFREMEETKIVVAASSMDCDSETICSGNKENSKCNKSQKALGIDCHFIFAGPVDSTYLLFQHPESTKSGVNNVNQNYFGYP